MPSADPPSRSRSGSETRRRRHTKMIRFDDDELARVEEAASRAGLAFASYGRAQMLGAPAPRSVRRPPIEKELLARVLGQLGKVGSNLNQVARATNSTGAEIDEVRAAIAEVREAAQEVMRALGRSA